MRSLGPWLPLALLIVAGNVVAWMQADAMTRFREGLRWLPPIESLSLREKAAVLLAGYPKPRTPEKSPSDLGLERVERLRIATRDGVSLAAWRLGLESPRGIVLIFHGYSATKGSHHREAKALLELGWEVLLVDHRGHGGSSGNVSTVGYKEAEDVRVSYSLARRLRPRLPIVAYGHSMGSAAVLGAIAREGIAPEGLILELPFESLLQTVRNRLSLAGFPPFPMADLIVFWAGVRRGIPLRGFSPEIDAASVLAPTLIFAAGKDRRAPPTEAREVHAAIPRDSRFVLFPGLDHGLLLKRDPDRWSDSVGPFLEALARR